MADTHVASTEEAAVQGVGTGAPLCLTGVGFWAPKAVAKGKIGKDGADSTNGATATAGTTGTALPAAELLGPRVRGRASLLTLMFAEVLGKASSAAQFELGSSATIYGSALGEMERLIELLEGMQGSESEVSPLRFQTSVHNAAAGQISIASKNQRFSSSLAAGRSTVAMGFLEAATWMQTHEDNLILVLGDEARPPKLDEGPSYPPMAAAFAFMPAATAPPDALSVRVVRRPLPAWVAPSSTPGNSSVPPLVANPCDSLRGLVAWLGRESMGIFWLNGQGATEYGIERL